MSTKTTTASLPLKRSEPRAIKQGLFWRKKELSTKEMVEMLTIKSLSPKAELLFEAILEPQARMLTDPTRANLTTVPSERLIDIWECRFGNDWVDMDTIADDDFFSEIAIRLRTEGELEAHFLTDRARLMCRKPREE